MNIDETYRDLSSKEMNRGERECLLGVGKRET